MPELGGWTLTDHLLASVVDALQVVAVNALVGPHADPKRLKRLKPPTPVQRPHAQRQRRKATSDDYKRMFGGAAAYRPREVTG
jgi:hypothetical protein